MISFFINLYHLLKTVVVKIKNDGNFKLLFFVLVILLIGATFFYTQIEDWTTIDAFYFSVMTMSTVGYGDLVPTTTIGKIFTIIYTFLSIGTFVAFTAKTVEIIIENNQIDKFKFRKFFNQHKRKNENRRS